MEIKVPDGKTIVEIVDDPGNLDRKLEVGDVGFVDGWVYGEEIQAMFVRIHDGHIATIPYKYIDAVNLKKKE